MSKVQASVRASEASTDNNDLSADAAQTLQWLRQRVADELMALDDDASAATRCDRLVTTVQDELTTAEQETAVAVVTSDAFWTVLHRSVDRILDASEIRPRPGHELCEVIEAAESATATMATPEQATTDTFWHGVKTGLLSVA